MWLLIQVLLVMTAGLLYGDQEKGFVVAVTPRVAAQGDVTFQWQLGNKGTDTKEIKHDSLPTYSATNANFVFLRNGQAIDSNTINLYTTCSASWRMFDTLPPGDYLSGHVFFAGLPNGHYEVLGFFVIRVRPGGATSAAKEVIIPMGWTSFDVEGSTAEQ